MALRVRLSLWLWLLGTAMLIGNAWAEAPRYRLSILPTLGGDSSEAIGINNQGHVVGNIYWGTSPPAFRYRAFVYKRPGDMKLIPLLPDAKYSLGYKINDRGQVIGDMYRSFDLPRTAFLTDGERPADLGPVYLYGINNAGHVVGYASTDDLQGAFLYRAGRFKQLFTADEFAPETVAYAINDRGQITGRAINPSVEVEAFRFDRGVKIFLGQVDPNFGTEGRAINNAGHVAGAAFLRAFVYRSGKITDLGTLGGRQYVTAHGINDAGVVIGTVRGGREPTAFVYFDGKMQDLNKLTVRRYGFKLQFALDINETGQIVGSGLRPDGQKRGFLLTPIRGQTPAR
jgi:probable HAF family extracellular repeat protein